ncbi:MAG: undecaprenyldiphospho-muramoylpentapeptide beta-N-acetylglucosaminyltransferase [Rhodospirillaceae bacterium]|nr:undecaprenyldiphospho-muramoylpentapeptide beta-N-acetylglucosaminyltransferase [Rhodospirillaceae bacterium]
MIVRRIALAAGGTGGHVFPGLSLAEALVGRGHVVHVLTDTRGTTFHDTIGKTCTVHKVRAASPSQSGPAAKLGAIVQLSLGVLDARGILKRNRIDGVVGFGGYPSVPAVIAGSIGRLPTILHEQNAVLGRANRWLLNRATAIATSFEHTAGLSHTDIKVARTGNPVRASIAARRNVAYGPFGRESEFHLCVFGGSLGAEVFSNTVPAAIASLDKDLRARLVITQQCRPEDLEQAESFYRNIDQAATIQTFFNDIPEKLAAAQLVVARAGASTVAELGVIGRPAILVPYSHAMDDHQSRNAEALEAAGAAWCMSEDRLSADLLATRLRTLMEDPHKLATAARSAWDFGIPDAAERLADFVLEHLAERAVFKNPSEVEKISRGANRTSERRALA